MEAGKEVLILNLDDVLPNRFQPRIKFNEQSILELAESIREHGVIQPIVVRRIADKYEIIAGERRYKASVLAGKTTIPAIVTDLDDKNSAEVALIENVQRQDLTPIEEAISYKKILDMGYLNQASLAEKLGKTQSTIANKLRLLNLDDEVQEALLGEKISERHARSLLKLEKQDQVEMLNRILTERMTVRKTDEEIMKLFNRKSNEKKSMEKEDMIEPMIPLQNVEPNVFENGMGNMNIPPQPVAEVVQPQVQPIPEVVNQSVTPIDEVRPIIPTSSMDQVKPVVNPGFMDIDKIESQARDIFPPQPQPARVEQVEPLVPSIEPVTPIPNPMVQPIMEQPIENSEDDNNEGGARPTVGRFFNMLNREENQNPNFVSNVEEKEVNMEMNGSQPTVNPIFNFNPISTPTEPSPTISSNPSSVQTTQEENQQPFVAQPNFNNPNTENVTPQPIVETESDEPFQTINPYTLTDDADFTGPIIAPAEIVEPSNIINQPITPIELQPLRENSEVTQSVKVDMKTVINTVRDCVSTIEDYGYVVDEDEIDLENSYQITITIDKR